MPRHHYISLPVSTMSEKPVLVLHYQSCRPWYDAPSSAVILRKNQSAVIKLNKI